MVFKISKLVHSQSESKFVSIFIVCVDVLLVGLPYGVTIQLLQGISVLLGIGLKRDQNLQAMTAVFYQ